MDNTITVADLHRIKNILEVACTRGAFQANEMRSVGEVYERLSSFLAAVPDQSEQPDQSESQPKENHDD